MSLTVNFFRRIQLANTSSALKRMRQNERRRLRNRGVRSKVRTAVKTARTALGVAATDAREAVAEAIRALDKAVTKGVIHRNTAARKKSTLARRLSRHRHPCDAAQRDGHELGFRRQEATERYTRRRQPAGNTMTERETRTRQTDSRGTDRKRLGRDRSGGHPRRTHRLRERASG